jgi:arginyl-tRNA synthetase
MNYKEKIIKFLNKELKTKLDENILEIPPSEDMGDYAFPCFVLSKKFKKSPIEIAKKLEKLKKPSFVEKLESKGPYLNFYINKSSFTEKTIKQILKEKSKYGYTNLGKNKRVMIEFSQPNTHKPFHVGHLRNVCMGDYLVHLYNFTNHTVIPVNYINDGGSHVAKVLWALEKYYKNTKIPKNKGKYLGKIYVDSTKKAEKEKNKEEISKILQELETQNSKLMKLWKKTREWSLKEFKDIYKQLNVNFDYYFYESEIQKKGRKIVDLLVKKKIAKKDQGALLVNLEKYNLKKFLVRKSDGTSLYSTKDLALAKEKFEKFKIDESLYVVGSEQIFYFRQLFKTLELIGFKKPMKHISYGLVVGKDGKFSSRLGNVPLYEDFYEEVLNKTLKDLKKRYKWSKTKLESTAKSIVLGALKFTMLNQDSNKEIIFDINKALSFEGDTCPYLQYSYARINSILKKVKKDTPKYNLLKKQVELKLIRKLSIYPEIIEKSKQRDSPHILTNYVLELARIFNEFYHSCHIIKAEKGLKGARMNLILATKQVLENSFKLFNIPLLKEM